MIKPFTVNAGQRRALERFLNDQFKSLICSEVLAVQDEGDCYKLFYVFEGENGRDVRGSLYFAASFRDNTVEDIIERKF